jgi:hypothetical protein
MEFSYNPEFGKNYSKQNCIKMTILYFSLGLFVLLSIFIFFHNYENRMFIILFMACCIFVSIISMVLFWYKKYIKDYNSFKLNITDEHIEIKSNSINKIIKIYQIKNIFIDNQGNIFIEQSKFNQIKILKYIENNTELKTILSNIKSIESIKKKVNYVFYIPSILLIGIIIINRIGSIPLYIIFALGIIISSIYSSIVMIFSGNKKNMIIGNIIINLLFVIIFSFGLLNAITYLLNR